MFIASRSRMSRHRIGLQNRSIDAETNRDGKSRLKRIVSMLTRLIQRTESVAEGPIEYEYRDAEYEYEYEKEWEAVF